MDLHRRDRDIPGRLCPLPGLARYGHQASGAQALIAVAGLYHCLADLAFMKCPRRESAIASPGGRTACVNGVDVLMVICPRCETILGVVHQSHSSYFSQGCTRGSVTQAQ